MLGSGADQSAAGWQLCWEVTRLCPLCPLSITRAGAHDWDMKEKKKKKTKVPGAHPQGGAASEREAMDCVGPAAGERAGFTQVVVNGAAKPTKSSRSISVHAPPSEGDPTLSALLAQKLESQRARLCERSPKPGISAPKWQENGGGAIAEFAQRHEAPPRRRHCGTARVRHRPPAT